MCANYQPTEPKKFSRHLHCEEPGFSYGENTYPGSRAVFITAGSEYESQFSSWPGVFGLLPPWFRDEKLSRNCYNACSETVDFRPSFKGAWKARRLCLIPAQALFEPNHESGHAQRWRIQRAYGLPFCVAGIWEPWPRDKGTLWPRRGRISC